MGTKTGEPGASENSVGGVDDLDCCDSVEALDGDTRAAFCDWDALCHR